MEQIPVYLPFLIFFARIIDVSIGTVRIVMVMNGHRLIASALGFFEVVIWVLAVGGALAYLSNPFALIAYGAGFACGVYVGMLIEDRIAVGYRVIRVINPDATVDLCTGLRERGFRVTRVTGQGRDGDVEIAFAATRRKNVAAVREAVALIAPRAFMTVERVERPFGGDFAITKRTPFAALGGMRK